MSLTIGTAPFGQAPADRFNFEPPTPSCMEPSDTLSECANKGTAGHWNARVGDRVVPDVAWTYDDEVRREGEPVRGLIAFYNERVDLDVDGIRGERPSTVWSRES